MIYVHGNNLETKIIKNYNNKAAELVKFEKEKYLPFRNAMLEIDFSHATIEDFKKVATIVNDYSRELAQFAHVNNITAQSKFESTLLEELNVYLFKDIPEIKDKKLDVYNKGIYAGLKINPDLTLDIVKKDVDFCIGKKVTMTIENQTSIVLTIPIISVEVKTYLDATMFGEVKSSSKTLKSATPNSKAYVLMGYKCLSDSHILAARQDSTLDEMFVLKSGEGQPIDPYALYIYWQEITNAIKTVTTNSTLKVPGRLLADNEMYDRLKKEDK